MNYTLAYAFRIEQAFIVQVTGIQCTRMGKRGHVGLVEATEVILGSTAQRDHLLVSSSPPRRRREGKWHLIYTFGEQPTPQRRRDPASYN